MYSIYFKNKKQESFFTEKRFIFLDPGPKGTKSPADEVEMVSDKLQGTEKDLKLVIEQVKAIDKLTERQARGSLKKISDAYDKMISLDVELSMNENMPLGKKQKFDKQINDLIRRLEKIETWIVLILKKNNVNIDLTAKEYMDKDGLPSGLWMKKFIKLEEKERRRVMQQLALEYDPAGSFTGMFWIFFKEQYNKAPHEDIPDIADIIHNWFEKNEDAYKKK